MSEWKKVKLGEICERITSGGTPKANISSYYDPPTIPWLKTKEVNYCRIRETENYISEEGLNNSSAKLIAPNSVIIAMYGQGDTAGRVAINKIPLTTNQACCNLTINKDKADYEFIYYQLCTLYNKMVSLKAGAAQPNLNAQIIKNLEVLLPSLQDQHRIATILSRYDSLIENYQKQIKLLEEAAQRLYKEWFVDLHFPGHENTKIVDGVPEGWEKNAFGSVIEYEIGGGWGSDTKTSNEIIPAYVIRGTDISALDMGVWKVLPYRFHQESNYKARQLMHNDIIFEVSGGSKNEGVAKTFLVQQELLDKLDNHVICASFCKLIRLKDSSIAYYIYDTLKEWRASGITAQYDKRSASSIVNYRWKDFLSQQEILIPKEIVLHDYIKKSELIRSLITKKSSQIRLLTEARDRLLPKLMSGEIKA